MIENLLLNNVTAIIIVAVIFATALLLAIKKWASPGMIFVLLLFCLLVGITIANQDLIRYHLSNEPGKNSPEISLQMAQFREETLRHYENLKAELEIQKRKQQMLEREIQEIKDKNPQN